MQFCSVELHLWLTRQIVWFCLKENAIILYAKAEKSKGNWNSFEIFLNAKRFKSLFWIWLIYLIIEKACNCLYNNWTLSNNFVVLNNVTILLVIIIVFNLWSNMTFLSANILYQFSVIFLYSNHWLNLLRYNIRVVK